MDVTGASADAKELLMGVSCAGAGTLSGVTIDGAATEAFSGVVGGSAAAARAGAEVLLAAIADRSSACFLLAN